MPSARWCRGVSFLEQAKENLTNDSPRSSATLLLVRDDPFEVLMVRRSARGAFASALVFPGGALDAEDESPDWEPLVEDFAAFPAAERAVRIAAIRETWEETSMLVVPGSVGAPAAGIPTGLSFRDFVEQRGVRLRLDAVTPFGHWVTPEGEPRRFDTRFFLAAAPAGQVAVADGGETVGIEWVRPEQAALAARRREQPIIFPTLMNLERLAESGRVEDAITAARARPDYTVRPTAESQPDGSTVLTIPAEAGYSVTRFVP